MAAVCACLHACLPRAACAALIRWLAPHSLLQIPTIEHQGRGTIEYPRINPYYKRIDAVLSSPLVHLPLHYIGFDQREMSSPADVFDLANSAGGSIRVLTNPRGWSRPRTSASDIANGGPPLCDPTGKMSITARRMRSSGKQGTSRGAAVMRTCGAPYQAHHPALVVGASVEPIDHGLRAARRTGMCSRRSGRTDPPQDWPRRSQ